MTQHFFPGGDESARAGFFIRGRDRHGAERIVFKHSTHPIGIELAFVLADEAALTVFHDLEEGIKDCDVVITLRLQSERMSGALLPSSQEYFKQFGLTPEKLQLAKPDAIVMHPGPINRGVEIDSAVVDGPQSVILPQVTFGIAVRMAVMSIVAGNEA